jgi:pimeloyl-ACP methyl ester carboxylesterase
MNNPVDDSREAVVLLHSSGMSGRQWRRLATRLEKLGLRTLVPDLTGHGAAPVLSEATPFSFRDDVAHIAKLLAAQASPVHLVGHSYGGLIALLAAREDPARVRSLTVYDPVAFGVLDPTADADALATLARVAVPWGVNEGDHDRWLASFVDYWGGDGAWEALRDDARAEFRRVGWAVYQGVATLSRDTTPALDYGVIGARTLLLTGEHTPLAARRVIERLAKALPDVRVVTVEGAGHMGPLTHTVVDEAVASFITGRSPA